MSSQECKCWFASWPPILTTPQQTEYEHHGENDQKNEEQDFRDLGRAGRNTTETEKRRNERDYEKYCCPIQHGFSPFSKPRPAMKKYLMQLDDNVRLTVPRPDHAAAVSCR